MEDTFLPEEENMIGADGFNFWLIKTDANGDSLWSRTFGGSPNETCVSVKQAPDSGYVLAGNTQLYNSDVHDVWLIKTDMNGDSIWGRVFDGWEDDYCASLQIASDGGCVLAGYTSSFANGGNRNYWLIKTDANGDSLWSHIYGGNGDDECQALEKTSDGGYILGGFTTSYGAGGKDIWMLKTNADGDSLWSRTFGTNLSELFNDIQQTSDGGYILLAKYGIASEPQGFWLLKTGPERTPIDPSSALQPSSFNLSAYPNPFNPSTTLCFTVPREMQISLDVFDLTGRKVESLFSGTAEPGEHSINWTCPTCASGMYFSRLQAEGQTVQRKLLLLK